jgi:LEA14-like dessication related protein
MKKRIFIAGAAAALMLLGACAFLQQRLAVRNCTFKLVEARAGSFTFTDMAVNLNIAVYNPNPIAVAIDKLDLILLINDHRTVKAVFSGQSINPQATKNLTTTVTIPYMTAGMAIIEILKKNQPVRYRLDGEIFLNTPIGMVNFPVTIYESK